MKKASWSGCATRLVVLEETYEFLNMNWRKDAPAAEVIWTHDRDLLQNALSFYADLREKFGLEKDEFIKLNDILSKEKPQGGFDAKDLGRHSVVRISASRLAMSCLVCSS